jgi:hypothetical protein
MKFFQQRVIKIFFFVGVIALSGCSKENLFGSKDGPDAFLATENAPLTPLQSGEIGAPLPKPVPGYLPPDKKAVQAVENVSEIFKVPKNAAPVETETELKQALSEKLKGGLVNAGSHDIEKTDRELSAIYAEEQKNISVLEKWAGSKAKPDPVIDVEEEQVRLDSLMKNQPADTSPKKRNTTGITVPISPNKPAPNRNETGWE